MLAKIKIFNSKKELEDKVPLGSIISLQIEGRNIALTQTKNKFYAFLDSCPHNRVPLSDGKCNIYDEIVCPWHNYRFDLQTGNETSGHGLFLKTFHLEIVDDAVYLTL